MSWNESMAKEFYQEEATVLIKANGKKTKAALNREPDWDDAHLVIKEHLNFGEKVKIKKALWEVIDSEGLGMFYKSADKGYRVYILKPLPKYKIGDTVRLLRKKELFIIISIEESGLWYQVKATDGSQKYLSMFFQDYIIKV